LQRDPEPGARSFALVLKRVLGRLGMLCFRHGALTLLVAAAAAVVAAFGASRLKLDPDLSELLPPWYESVKNVEALRERFGGVGNVVVVVRGGTPKERHAFADAVAPELARLPTVHYVDARRPNEFFDARALYFVDKADLETIRDRLDARLRHEVARAQLDLDDEAPPPVETGDIRKKYEARLHEATGSGSNESPYYENANELAIFVHPTDLASNLEFSRKVTADVARVVERVSPAKFGRGLETELAGRYKKRVDLERVLVRDLAFTGSLAFGLVLLYVALHFRRLSAVLLVMTPLLLGLELVYGLAGFGFGTLNVLTAFVGAILLGIGIDNGIHLLGRYDEARRDGCEPERAVCIALADAGRVSVAAALTTAAAFGCLALSDFRAFREFGLLTAGGMLLLLASYVTVLPALLGLFTRFLPRTASLPRDLHLPFVPLMMRRAPWVLGVVAVVLAGFAARAPKVQFDADFSALDRADLPSFHLDPEINQLLGRSQTPLVVLAANDAQADAAAESLRKRMASLGSRATIGQVATLSELVPSDQAEKQPVLAQIAKTLGKFSFEKLSPEERRDAERLETMAQAAPFTRADLPESVLAPFEARDGSGPGHFVLAFPTVSMSNGPAVRELAHQVKELEAGEKSVLSVAGEPMVMADILETVERDAPRILTVTLLLVAVLLRLTAGSWLAALLAALPAVLTAATSAGLLSILDIDLNYLNMIVIPILLGISVDDGMHIVTRVAEGEPLETVWRHTGWNIFGAILTDIFGFGVLAFAEHPGLASFGRVALVGLVMNLVICVVLLPAFLTLRQAFFRARLREPSDDELDESGRRTPAG
jgi:predicted RND superfamily exporter protein